MNLSPEQDNAVKVVNDWYQNGSKQVCHLFGYAGTGKTTLAKHFAENISGEVLFAAYTGKAAHVLRSKGCENASTIHSLIYRSKQKSEQYLKELEEALENLILNLQSTAMPDKEIEQHRKVKEFRKEIEAQKRRLSQPSFTLNPESEAKDAKLIIIDECSMVNSQVAEDLLSFKTPVLVLGDPAQLPPVKSAGYFTENVKPDVMLQEIHRQAKESPILRMATMVRQGESLAIGDYGQDCKVLPPDKRLGAERVLAYDQLLVGKNATRCKVNKRIRKMLGFDDPWPMQNDRLVCLRNNNDAGLLNGEIFSVVENHGMDEERIYMNVQSETTLEEIEVAAQRLCFNAEKPPYIFHKNLDEAYEFDYGYGLTVHKAQGSQWDSVLLFNEMSWGTAKDQRRWLYTAITRAAKDITIIMDK